jgi:hypothetical protein
MAGYIMPPAGAIPVVQTFDLQGKDDPQIDKHDHEQGNQQRSCRLELIGVGIDLAHAVELRDELDGRGQHPGYELDDEKRDPKIEELDPTSKAE